MDDTPNGKSSQTLPSTHPRRRRPIVWELAAIWLLSLVLASWIVFLHAESKRDAERLRLEEHWNLQVANSSTSLLQLNQRLEAPLDAVSATQLQQLSLDLNRKLKRCSDQRHTSFAELPDLIDQIRDIDNIQAKLQDSQETNLPLRQLSLTQRRNELVRSIRHKSEQARQPCQILVSEKELPSIASFISFNWTDSDGKLSLTLLWSFFALTAYIFHRIRQNIKNYRIRCQQLQLLGEQLEALVNGDNQTRILGMAKAEWTPVYRAVDKLSQKLATTESVSHETKQKRKDLQRFSQGVSLQLKEPLGILRGYLRTVDVNAPTEALKEELNILDVEAAACEQVIEELQVYAGDADLIRDKVNLKSFLEMQTLEFLHRHHSLSTRIEVDAADVEFEADQARLKAAVIRMLLCAIPDGTDEQLIKLIGEQHNDHIIIKVHSNLPFPNSEELIKLLLPYGQNPSLDLSLIHLSSPNQRTRAASRQGIGLALVDGIALLHHGSFSCLESEQSSTQFVFRIPREQPTVISMPRRSSLPTPRG